MSLESELHDEMIALYRRAGDATGYWGSRYLQAVRRHGGLARAKEMLKPRTASQRTGLDVLLQAGRPDLTLEAIVLQPRFAALFTVKELEEARSRLVGYRDESAKAVAAHQRLYPDEIPPGTTFPEGARKQVRVNAYERSAAARKACLAHFGHACVVCKIDFSVRYGEIGKDFIHVHHLRPLAKLSNVYQVDPESDLVPVCPNCHAMLHRAEPPLSVEQLRDRMKQAKLATP